MADYPKLEQKAVGDKRVRKVLHDYPILLRRTQSMQEMIKELIEDPTIPTEETTELQALVTEFDQRIVKKQRDDKPPIGEREAR